VLRYQSKKVPQQNCRKRTANHVNEGKKPFREHESRPTTGVKKRTGIRVRLLGAFGEKRVRPDGAKRPQTRRNVSKGKEIEGGASRLDKEDRNQGKDFGGYTAHAAIVQKRVRICLVRHPSTL